MKERNPRRYKRADGTYEYHVDGADYKPTTFPAMDCWTRPTTTPSTPAQPKRGILNEENFPANRLGQQTSRRDERTRKLANLSMQYEESAAASIPLPPISVSSPTENTGHPVDSCPPSVGSSPEARSTVLPADSNLQAVDSSTTINPSTPTQDTVLLVDSSPVSNLKRPLVQPSPTTNSTPSTNSSPGAVFSSPVPPVTRSGSSPPSSPADNIPGTAIWRGVSEDPLQASPLLGPGWPLGEPQFRSLMEFGKTTRLSPLKRWYTAPGFGPIGTPVGIGRG